MGLLSLELFYILSETVRTRGARFYCWPSRSCAALSNRN
jgi:hypothetical protein